MSGYTPVFDSIFQGSLCGKYPDLPVWLVLLAMQQRGGIIDAHPSFIATVSGLPQADIETAIARFCEPDPHSRTPDNDGRRLEPLEGRGFGWRILNHNVYREKARLMSKNQKDVETGKNRERMKDRRRPPETADDPLSEAEAKAEPRTLRSSSSESLPTSPSGRVREGGTSTKKEIRKAALETAVAAVSRGMVMP